LRSSKVKGQGHVQLTTYGFLIVHHSNYVSICYHYDVMQKATRIGGKGEGEGGKGEREGGVGEGRGGEGREERG